MIAGGQPSDPLAQDRQYRSRPYKITMF